MKPWKIRILVASVSVALLVLVYIQLIWIKNAIELEQKNFASNIHKSLDEVVRDLELQETFNIFYKLARDPEVGLSHKDNSFGFPGVNPDGTPQLNYLNIRDKREFQNADARGSSPPNSVIDSNMLLIDLMLSSPDIVNNDKFVSKLMREVNLSQNRSFVERINTMVLDSLLDVILLKNGITQAFYYEIIKGDKSFISAIESNVFNNDDENQRFATLLFPNEFSPRKNFLVLTFENDKFFFFKSITGLLIISITTFLLIITGFYYTVSSIFEQRRLAEMKTDFVNNMTHELKTPIATITLASEAIFDVDTGPEDSAVKRFSKMISEENQRLKQHVDRILNTAVLEKGDFQLNLSLVDINELVRKAALQNELNVRSRNGKITTVLNCTNATASLDELHLKNLIYNLIDNAIKYTKNDPEIIIETSNAPKGVNISVQDNGIGMTKAHQGRVFEKFYRVSTGDLHDVKGFGLGLTYVKFIVDSHGGKIKINSEIGKGSKFDIYLPTESVKI